MGARLLGAGVVLLSLSLGGCITESRVGEPAAGGLNTWQRYALIHQTSPVAEPPAIEPPAAQTERPLRPRRMMAASRDRLQGSGRCDPQRNPAAARDPACSRPSPSRVEQARVVRETTRSISIPAIDTSAQPTLPGPVSPTPQPPPVANPPTSITGTPVPYNPPSVNPVQVVSVPTFVDNLQTPFLNPSPTKGYVIVTPPRTSPRAGLGPVIRR